MRYTRIRPCQPESWSALTSNEESYEAFGRGIAYSFTDYYGLRDNAKAKAVMRRSQTAADASKSGVWRSQKRSPRHPPLVPFSAKPCSSCASVPANTRRLLLPDSLASHEFPSQLNLRILTL